MKIVKTALLGYGNIGGGVMKVLQENGPGIEKHHGVRFEIVHALVRDLGKKRAIDLGEGVLTTRLEDITGDPEVELVVEFMGGVHPSSDYMLACLEAGKTVVTANKEAIANTWPQLEAAAKAHGAGLYYEASVGGGIPIIRTLNRSMQANRMQTVMGIINGTTNSILTQMSEEHLPYAQALAQAQAAGLAEPDPTNDVEGFDTLFKLSILSSLAFHERVPIEAIYREGITAVTPAMLDYGRKMGYVMKLLAIGKCDEAGKIEVRVHPTFIPNSHPLASVSGSYNAIFLEGNAVGRVMLYGRGAGDLPTASSVISDMVNAVKTAGHTYSAFANVEGAEKEVVFEHNWKTRYFLSLHLADQPGVVAMVSGILARYEVSIASMIQQGVDEDSVPVVLITHETHEQAMQAAVKEIESLPTCIHPVELVRVEGDEVL